MAVGMPHSTAFERLVDASRGPDDEDLVGLLAYAYYKRDKRDLARSGDATDDS